ncbi:MAG: glycosyltransferase [Anaerolineales bacterium]|nr:glycosyltransferase [Anaerolineales bacterium]
MVFPGRLALQQRVLPAYRAPFFDLLAAACTGGLSVYSGQPRPVEGIAVSHHLERAHYVAGRNLDFRDPASSYYLCWQTGLVRWLEDWDPDALIVEANPRYLSTRLAVRWMHRRGRPVLGWGLGVPRPGNKPESWLRVSFLNALDGVLAYSRRGGREYRALGLQNVTLAYHAVSPRPETPPPIRPLPLQSPPTILFVGRLQARKRIDILLQACRDLPPGRQPHLVVVGDGPAREVFERQAAQIYPRASFVGALHGPDLDPYYAQADIFALPGTGGLAVQQAMAHGLPVIVAQGDGTQDDLVRPENGWQIPPGDEQAFSTVLREALVDLPRLRQMGAESYRIVSEEINLEGMVAAFVEALREVK